MTHTTISSLPSNESFYKANQYQELDGSRLEIRLLKLFIDNENEKIVCELLTKCFLAGGHLRYKAISYCAGDPSEITAIIVDGREFNSFTSLKRGLK
jgi:hypothetical protein